MEYLSDASFLGKLLVLPATVRLYWKVIGQVQGLFGLVFWNEEKKFYTIETWSSSSSLSSKEWWKFSTDWAGVIEYGVSTQLAALTDFDDW